MFGENTKNNFGGEACFVPLTLGGLVYSYSFRCWSVVLAVSKKNNHGHRKDIQGRNEKKDNAQPTRVRSKRKRSTQESWKR